MVGMGIMAGMGITPATSIKAAILMKIEHEGTGRFSVGSQDSLENKRQTPIENVGPFNL